MAHRRFLGRIMEKFGPFEIGLVARKGSHIR
jgi:hypothetical protein